MAKAPPPEPLAPEGGLGRRHGTRAPPSTPRANACQIALWSYGPPDTPPSSAGQPAFLKSGSLGPSSSRDRAPRALSFVLASHRGGPARPRFARPPYEPPRGAAAPC